MLNITSIFLMQKGMKLSIFMEKFRENLRNFKNLVGSPNKDTTKELSLCHKLKFSNSTQSLQPDGVNL